MGGRPIAECRVLCTPSTFGRKDPALRTTLEAAVKEVVYNPFGRPLKAAEVLTLVRDIDGYIAGIDEIDASALRVAGCLRVIAVYGVGFDRIDIDEATRRSIVVTTSRGANSTAVAELTIAFILSLARHLCAADGAVRRGEWPVMDGIGIKGKVVGLIGFGSIGREVARRLKGFGCGLLAHDPYGEQEAADECNTRMVSLDELLHCADFVSLHAPVTASTEKMVNREFIGRMKEGSFLINTARGELVDEQALVEALERGRLQGAALDCFIEEPPDKESALLRLPQVIVTPHTGSHTDEAINRMGWTALDNCLAVLRNERPLNIVNPEVLEV